LKKKFVDFILLINWIFDYLFVYLKIKYMKNIKLFRCLKSDINNHCLFFYKTVYIIYYFFGNKKLENLFCFYKD